MLLQKHGLFFLFSPQIKPSQLQSETCSSENQNQSTEVLTHDPAPASVSDPPLSLPGPSLPTFCLAAPYSSRKRKLFAVPLRCHAVPCPCVLAQAVPSARNASHCSVCLVTSYSCSHILLKADGLPSIGASVHSSIITPILFYHNYHLCFYPLPPVVWTP